MLSVIIPVYNEENAIVRTVSALKTVLQRRKIDFEIIVVNDGSSDQTKAKIQEYVSTLSKRYKAPVKIIDHPHNMGYGAAIKSGLKVSKFENCAIIDADATYSPEQLVELFYVKQSSGYDMVVGMRTGHFYKGSRGKQVLRYILRRIVEYMTGRSIPDINSGARVFNRSVAMMNLRILSDKFSFTTSLTLVFMMRNCFVHYEPISYFGRDGKTKVKIFSDSVRTLGFILSVAAFFNPVRIFFPIVLLIVFFGIAIGLLAVLKSSWNLFLLSNLILLTATLVFSMGIMSHIIGFKLGDNETR